MKTVVVYTAAPGPPAHFLKAAATADLVVLKHPDGMWSVWSDRFGDQIQNVCWDELPARVKREIPLYPAGT